eukprot:scaffold110762_cov76-Cyclotella_meneghiniana.AAC.2
MVDGGWWTMVDGVFGVKGVEFLSARWIFVSARFRHAIIGEYRRVVFLELLYTTPYGDMI